MVTIYETLFLIHEKYSGENLHEIIVDLPVSTSPPQELVITFSNHNSPFGFLINVLMEP